MPLSDPEGVARSVGGPGGAPQEEDPWQFEVARVEERVDVSWLLRRVFWNFHTCFELSCDSHSELLQKLKVQW